MQGIVNSVKDERRHRLGRPRVGIICTQGLNCVAALYAMKVLLETAGADAEILKEPLDSDSKLKKVDCVVSYGAIPPQSIHRAHLHICSSGFFTADQYLKRRSLPVDTSEVDGIVSLYPGLPVSAPTALPVVDTDIVAATFVLLTGYEEIVASGLIDKRGRRTADRLLQVRLGLMDRPVVNEYAHFLRERISALFPDVQFHKRTWRGADYAFAITRDIDSLTKYGPHSVKQLASLTVRKGLCHAYDVLRHQTLSRVWNERDPHDNLDEILDWEKELGIRSSLYFMPSNELGDSNYNLEELSRKWSFEHAISMGWEVGLHPGYRTHSDPVSFSEEKRELDRVLGCVAVGGRQHGLRFLPPHTWRHWEDSGFLYDSSMGFAEREGFRCGICTPFQPFDVLENRTMNLWEIPLTVMDCTLDAYRRLNVSEARKSMDGLLAQVKRHHGVFVLLWHNSYFGIRNSGNLHNELATFVQESKADSACIAPLREIVNIWIENSEV